MEKIKLELVLNENGNTFLNFWDWSHGNDVTAEVNTSGELIQNDKVITLLDFITQVKESVDKQ